MPSDLRQIRTFKQLVRYLEDELGWPLEGYDVEDLTYDYEADEIGLKAEEAAKVQSIRQLRPLSVDQPWGIFFIEFEKKQLPVVVLRRILSHLVIKKRASARRAERTAWHAGDLLFISAFGKDDSGREIGVAHFHEDKGDLPTLRLLGWDAGDTALKLEHVNRLLHERLRWREPGESIDDWRKRWTGAFRHRIGHVIQTADLLAERLAVLACGIRDSARELLEAESERGPLTKLYRGFRTALIHDLTPEGFADTYAQTIAYGLFTAAVNRTDMSGGAEATYVKADDMALMARSTSPFLREMLEAFLRVGGRKDGLDFDELGIQDIVELLRGQETDLPAILRDFGNRSRGEDPVIHFYEHFLSAYNNDLKVQRGVFYTPQPIVSYIVQSIHRALQTDFELEDGLASTVTWGEMIKRYPSLTLPCMRGARGEMVDISPDEYFVQILDPATGTATFPVEIIDVVHRHLEEKWSTRGLSAMPSLKGSDSSRCSTFEQWWNCYVPEALLPRITGFELLAAPYAIAHLKVGLKLTETGYHFGSKERAQIYLTNALEPPLEQLPLIGFEALAHEAQAVNEIKKTRRYTIVVGNPPYSNFGQLNRSDFILRLLEDYKTNLQERKINLDDDFIKFLRLAQYALQQSGTGIAGLITNNVYLDGITHRQMRRFLLEQFKRIHIIDLHGNTRRLERSPDGSVDENVFDIMVGVAIALMSMPPLMDGDCTAVLTNVYGTRESKYDVLKESYAREMVGDIVHPEEPHFRFEDVAAHEYASQYAHGVPVNSLFKVSQSPIQTKRDALTIHFTPEELKSVLSDLCALSPAQIRKKYALQPDGRDWQLDAAIKDVQRGDGSIIKILYKPFDYRWTYYTGRSRGFLAYPRHAIMKHILNQNIPALVFKRQATLDAFGYTYCLVVDCPFSEGLFKIDPRGREFLAPLQLLPDEPAENAQLELTVGASRLCNSNMAPEFLTALAGAVGMSEQELDANPTAVLNYAYAVLHSPSYRQAYRVFLPQDYPRLPLPHNKEAFDCLRQLGDKLVGTHLLRADRMTATGSSYEGEEFPSIGAVTFENGHVWIDGERACVFKGVRQEVWDFYLGGYRVCEKWLKSRKGRRLSREEISHFLTTVASIEETLTLQAAIDEAITEYQVIPV